MSIPGPQPSEGFRWTQAPWGRALQCDPLEAAAHHLFTGSDLTLRDDPREWAMVAEAMGVSVEDLLLIRQVHGAAVAVAAPGRSRPWVRPDADAIISDDPAAAIGVRVADCVPILLAEETGRAVGAIHAGWRGAMHRAPIEGVQAMLARFGVRPERLIAAIGPSIGPCCYEVGESVRAAFREAGHHADLMARWFSTAPSGTLHLDMWRTIRDQLEGAGIPPSRIHSADLCTRTHAAFFHSYRVSGAGAGRMVAAIRVRRDAGSQSRQ
jgi:polyphenol oxidase